ncbi:hypothetical protein [Puniceibacterium sediminis]|uniref:Uncharacterized protein n=1 Tax=Puniceibacterium sediminis TaxID=1608407 RepID=A0A238XD95_9RHOB|nr:hypothetical protein [Puniceibacterium sediminis]SNR55869.1 hypothetical protein SAMN06265370_11056 [Puniceibacterium sediminis]
MKSNLALTAILTFLAAPVLADHANPWAGEGDTVLSKNHEANQQKSVGTPGEGEMRGAMVQKARGKLEGFAGSGGAGKSRGGKGGRK